MAAVNPNSNVRLAPSLETKPDLGPMPRIVVACVGPTNRTPRLYKMDKRVLMMLEEGGTAGSHVIEEMAHGSSTSTHCRDAQACARYLGIAFIGYLNRSTLPGDNNRYRLTVPTDS